jgi:hypothetical protein
MPVQVSVQWYPMCVTHTRTLPAQQLLQVLFDDRDAESTVRHQISNARKPISSSALLNGKVDMAYGPLQQLIWCCVKCGTPHVDMELSCPHVAVCMGGWDYRLPAARCDSHRSGSPLAMLTQRWIVSLALRMGLSPPHVPPLTDELLETWSAARMAYQAADGSPPSSTAPLPPTLAAHGAPPTSATPRPSSTSAHGAPPPEAALGASAAALASCSQAVASAPSRSSTSGAHPLPPTAPSNLQPGPTRAVASEATTSAELTVDMLWEAVQDSFATTNFFWIAVNEFDGALRVRLGQIRFLNVESVAQEWTTSLGVDWYDRRSTLFNWAARPTFKPAAAAGSPCTFGDVLPLRVTLFSDHADRPSPTPDCMQALLKLTSSTLRNRPRGVPRAPRWREVGPLWRSATSAGPSSPAVESQVAARHCDHHVTTM